MNAKAIELEEKPFLIFQTWTGEVTPLVIDEADIPATQFGVCPWKIVNGAYEDRTPEEMAIYQAEFQTGQAQATYAKKSEAIETATFEHNGFVFPMHATARFHYGTINRTPANYKVMSVTGIVDVPQEQIPAFMNAYYTKINELTRPI